MEWRAFELRPGVPPEGMLITWPPERIAAARAKLEPVAREAGLEYGVRTHWYDATPAHEATEWAQAQGAADALRHAIFRAYFVHDRNIGSPEVLGELAAEVGLNAQDLRAALAEGRYREQVQAQYQEARALGITGVPAFIAGGYALRGAQPYDVFRQFMAHIGQAPRGQNVP